MKTETFINRIKEVTFTKKGELSARYYDSISSIKILKEGNKVHPFSWNRNLRHYSLIDKETKIREVLDVAKVDYTIGNDAPKGGKEGDYIELTKKGIAQLKEVELSVLLSN